ncbi:MAG: Biopolymer transporter Tol [Subtercola sp.]|jgi:TolB protein|nr:Biopolymer transporter Tol [Subtercola sp.]
MPQNPAPERATLRQTASLITCDIATGERQVVFTSSDLLFAAPNWSSDGRWLVVNGDGQLFKIRAPGAPDEPGRPEQTGRPELERIDLGPIPAINNDHVLSADGATVYVSAADGHLWAAALDGSDQHVITNDHGETFRHYLHGLSPDQRTLAYTGLTQLVGDARTTTNILAIPVAGGADIHVTDDEFVDDGPEFGPDGRWIYFNSERASADPGHAQLFRISIDGETLEQLTDDERVNWFAHPAPDDSVLAYLSFPPGTLGHPPDVEVLLRLRYPDGSIRDLTTVFGGQGTMNVPSWSPDSRQVAFVEYSVPA